MRTSRVRSVAKFAYLCGEMKKSVIEYLAACCRGASQVMLQRSVLTGVLFLVGILAGGWPALVLASVSLMLATIVCGHKRQGYADGLWGFNALLVGCAASVFPCPDAALLAIIVYLTIPLKQILDRLFARIGVSSLTLPFILASWAFIGAARWLGACDKPDGSLSADSLWPGMPDVVAGLLKGLSQVFLVDSWVAGVLILVGLLVASRRVAAWALAGSAIGMACAAICGCAGSEIVSGLWGYSPALTAIAVGVTFGRESVAWRQVFVTIGAVILTFVIQLAAAPVLASAGLPVLTLPFCLATWITVALK